jgi:hypothetical protein
MCPPSLSSDSFLSISSHAIISYFLFIFFLKARDVFLSDPTKNIADGVPTFSAEFRRRFIAKYEFSTKTARSIEEVYFFTYFSSIHNILLY